MSLLIRSPIALYAFFFLDMIKLGHSRTNLQALNLQTNSEQRLEGPKGQVHALAVFNDMLLAGAQVCAIFNDHNFNFIATEFH